MYLILKHLKGDKVIWFIVVALSMFSMLAVYSSTGTLAFKQHAGSTEYYFIKHTTLLVLGFGLMYLAHLVNYNYYSRIAQLMLYLAIPLLFFTLFFGNDVNQAKRWLTLPVINISFQTSDLAKLALIMYVARVLSKKQHVIKSFERAFLPVSLPVMLVCILIVPADLSTAAVLFFTCLILMFIGRVRVTHIGLSLLVTSLAFVTFLGIASMTDYQGRMKTWQNRIENYVSGEAEETYQMQQSKIAIASGGLVRVAPGKSVQRNFLPHPYSDFIYAIIMEEYGLLGGIIIMILYLAFLYRAIKIFARSPGAFGALLAVGLSITLVIQALMNMSVTVGLLPVTGLTLPLVSMGGTSIWFTSLAIGIILSVSRYTEEQELGNGDERLANNNIPIPPENDPAVAMI